MGSDTDAIMSALDTDPDAQAVFPPKDKKNELIEEEDAVVQDPVHHQTDALAIGWEADTEIWFIEPAWDPELQEWVPGYFYLKVWMQKP